MNLVACLAKHLHSWAGVLPQQRSLERIGQDSQSSVRSVPVRWELAPVVKKPGRRATAQELAAYRQQKNE
jgi:hypothetical protein